MSSSDAETHKTRANELFQSSKFQAAVDEYTKAIELNSQSAVYLSNRAFAYYKLEAFGAAIIDATNAIDVDPNYIKGYYRRGSASFALGKVDDALRDFRQVVKIVPNDADAKKKLKDCEKAVKERAFAEAIAGEYEVKVTLLDSMDLETIAVDSDYTGPRLDGDITAEFVLQLIETFKAQGKLHRKYALKIMKGVRDIFSKEPTMLEVPVPEGRHFTVCGDVHAQFYDFINIFALNGHPSPENPYLFNGDFVDRGSFGVEVIMTMFAYKLLYPTAFYMVRGNHETKNMNMMYGFTGEVTAKYSAAVMDCCTEIFNMLPLCCVLGGKIFIVHGGLPSDDGKTLDDIRKISRIGEPPESGLMCDLLWSDPQPFNGRSPSKRGVGKSFGPDITRAFLDSNGLQMVVRSHEVKDEGYQVEAEGRLVTVFSAPNYCDQIGNKGAFIRFDTACRPQYTSFVHVPHPPIRPMAYANPALFGMMG